MKALFAPAVAMLNRMRYPKKFALLGLIALLAARCKTPRNRASSGPRHSISHDFIPGIGFSIPF